MFISMASREREREEEKLTTVMLGNLLRVLGRPPRVDVVQLGHDVAGAADKVPDVEEAARGRGRRPRRVRLEGRDEVAEAGGDLLTDLRGGEARGGGCAGAGSADHGGCEMDLENW